MTTVIFIFLVCVAFDFVAKEKLKLDLWLMTSRRKIFYKIGSCGFCFTFWVGAIATIMAYFLPDIFLVPFAVSGVWILVNKYFSNNE